MRATFFRIFSRIFPAEHPVTSAKVGQRGGLAVSNDHSMPRSGASDEECNLGGFLMEQQNMSQADRKTTASQRMQPVLIDAEGQIWPVTSPFFWVQPRRPDGNIIDYAVSKLGFINIWPIDESSIVVSLHPDLVHPKTMTAAFYAIADLRPVRVFVSATNTRKQRWEVFRSVRCALKRIDRMVTTACRSPLGSKLLRVRVYLMLTDNARPWHVLRLLHARAFTQRRSNAAMLVARGLGLPCRAAGKAAILASGVAAPFLTRLAAVSSLSSAP
jgi:hypothetical protein